MENSMLEVPSTVFRERYSKARFIGEEWATSNLIALCFLFIKSN